MSRKLLADESGFIISAELVLVATLLVIGLIVGMSEVQHAVVAELNDVADAIGSANQSYHYSGFTKRDWGWGGWYGYGCGVHAYTAGSVFVDLQDECDLNQCMLACNPPVVEAPKTGGAYGYGYGYGGAYGVQTTIGAAGSGVVSGSASATVVPTPAAAGAAHVETAPVPCPGGCDESDKAAPCPGGCEDNEHPEPAPAP
jgi:hypothetical protein